MIQKCSPIAVMKVFFKEPTSIHFIKEIGRKIKLAPTSVRNNIKDLVKAGLIIEKKAKPFDGFVANRDSQKFRDYKQVYNLYSLCEIKEEIVNKIGPKALVLFGSYQKGEDIESSDVDMFVLSKVKTELNLDKFEKELGRKIHITVSGELEDLDKNIRENIKKGWILYGSI